MTTIIPVIPDLQVPFQDDRAVAAMATFIADRNLDSVCVGDVLDSPQISRWHKGQRGEFAGSIAKDRDKAVKILRDLRVRHLTRSNHDDRLEKAVEQYVPALSGIEEFTFEHFMRLDSINCEFHRKPWSPAPGWLLFHGDESSISQVPGSTAMNLVRKTGMSVVCGHTHRLGMQHQGQSFAGRTHTQLWGLEVGNAMDMSSSGASYLKAGIANWQQGFGLLIVDGKDVTPMPVPIKNGRFYLDGKVWRG